jgi:hypothetical protein
VDLSTTGTVSVLIPEIYNGSYYLTIKHRNHISVTTAIPVSFAGNSISYDFSTSSSKAFGNNLQNISGVFALFGGDVNQDGLVESSDMIDVDNGVITWSTGYLPYDVNGDGIIDSGDMILIDNNAAAFVGAVIPNQ